MAGVRAGSRVLDVAAGAGGQSLAAARRAGDGGSVLATDISPKMLEFAARRAREAGSSTVDTAVLDGERLEGEEASFDAVISRVVGSSTSPTGRPRCVACGARSSRAGGSPGSSTRRHRPTASSRSRVSIIRRRAELPPPAPGQPGPFSIGDPGVIGAEYERAGSSEIETRRMAAPLRLPSAAACVRFQQESFGALHQMLARLSENGRAEARQEIETELGRFEGPDGFAGPCELIIAAGTK